MLRYNYYNSKNMGIMLPSRGITNYTLRGGSVSAPSYLSLISVVEKAGRLLTHFERCCFVTSGDLSRFPSSIFIIHFHCISSFFSSNLSGYLISVLDIFVFTFFFIL